MRIHNKTARVITLNIIAGKDSKLHKFILVPGQPLDVKGVVLTAMKANDYVKACIEADHLELLPDVKKGKPTKTKSEDPPSDAGDTDDTGDNETNDDSEEEGTGDK